MCVMNYFKTRKKERKKERERERERWKEIEEKSEGVVWALIGHKGENNGGRPLVERGGL